MKAATDVSVSCNCRAKSRAMRPDQKHDVRVWQSRSEVVERKHARVIQQLPAYGLKLVDQLLAAFHFPAGGRVFQGQSQCGREGRESGEGTVEPMSHVVQARQVALASGRLNLH